MGITIIGAGISGLLTAFQLINKNKDVTLIEKGKPISERIINLKDENSYYCPYGDGGRIFFNFKPFILDEIKDISFINILKTFNLYPSNNIVTINIMVDLIKDLHFYISERAKTHYNTEVIDFIEKHSKLSGVKLSNGTIIEDDDFIFSFGNLNRLTYKKLLEKGGAISSLSSHLPLKISVKLTSFDEFEEWNRFIESKPFFAFKKHLFFIDEYQKTTKIVPIQTHNRLISYENLSYNMIEYDDIPIINFNLNISLTQNNLSGFGKHTLRNFAFLSLIEANQAEVKDKMLMSLDDFMDDNIYDSVLTPWLTESFRIAFKYFFIDWKDNFLDRILIHGLSTASLRAVQLTTDSDGRFLTYPNVKVVGNAKEDFNSLKEKILKTLELK